MFDAERSLRRLGEHAELGIDDDQHESARRSATRPALVVSQETTQIAHSLVGEEFSAAREKTRDDLERYPAQLDIAQHHARGPNADCRFIDVAHCRARAGGNQLGPKRSVRIRAGS